MSEDEVWFGLFYDKACSRMLPQKTVDDALVWVLDFGRLDAGMEKTSEFYIKNVSGNVIEDLKVELGAPVKEKVSVRVISEELGANKLLSKFEPGDVHRVAMQWIASSDASAEQCQATITITGMILEEHRLYA